MPDQAGDVPATCADLTRSRCALGYDPKVPLPEGIRRFVQWLRQEVAAEVASPARDRGER
jgi:UDP-glucuronate 4-epimerase